MRHFTFGYTFTANNMTGLNTGQISFSVNKFPPLWIITEEIKTHLDPQKFEGVKIVVISVFEFKNDIDYTSFISEPK